MRVAFLAPEFVPTWGGVGIYSVNLVKELSKDPEMEIHVITPKRDDYDEKKIEEMFDNKIKVHQISTANDTFFYNFKFQLAVWRKFKKLHKQYNFDLIHSANLVHMPDIWLKFGKQRIPSLVTAHTTIKGQVQGFLQGNKNFFKMAPSEKGSILAYPVISTLEKIYLKRSKNLITVSNKFAKQFSENGYRGNINVTHNGIAMELFDYDKVEDPYKEFPQLREIKEPIILFAGRIITQKGIEVFVKMMKELQERNVHFVIAGRGDAEGLKKLLKNYEIKEEKYTFLGFINNHKLPGLYKLSSVFVLPSYYENFPISLLEAMAMKCCCVATNVGAVDEIIDDAINGFIIKPGDVKDLVEKIKYLLENEQDRIKMAENGYLKVKNNFTSKVMGEKTKRIYEEMLK
ncbi:MAG: glycosyltransferase family 4 protein [Candidatus Nanoarchaeia archaeon]